MRDFSDLVKTTHAVFTDKRGLQEFRILCKRYQLVMCRAIRLQGGEILHTAGDAFVAVFRGDGAAGRAFTSARHMMSSVAELRERTEFRSICEGFVTRIGLATGTAQYGYLGPYELKEATVFGQCVNIGSRLEGAVKVHSPDGGILMTGETADELTEKHRKLLEEVPVYIKELDKEVPCHLLALKG